MLSTYIGHLFLSLSVPPAWLISHVYMHLRNIQVHSLFFLSMCMGSQANRQDYQDTQSHTHHRGMCRQWYVFICAGNTFIFCPYGWVVKHLDYQDTYPAKPQSHTHHMDIYSGTSDNGHSEEWTTVCPLYTLSMHFYLQRRDNLRTMDKMLVLNMSIIRRFHCIFV